MSSREGSAIIARPIASICCSPPESDPASWPRRSARRGKVPKALSRLRSRALRFSRVAPTMRFSSTLRSANTRRPSGHESDAPVDPGMSGRRGDVPAAEPYRARAHREQTGQGHDGGALAGAVGADETEDLARADDEGKAVHGDDIAVAAGQIRDLEHRIAHWMPRIRHGCTGCLNLPQGAGMRRTAPDPGSPDPVARAGRTGGSTSAPQRSSRLSRLCTGRSSSTWGRRARIPAALGSKPS